MQRGRAVVGAVAAAGALVASALVGGGAGSAPRQGVGLDELVRLNQIQTIGSHNSYKMVPPKAETDLRRSFLGEAEDAMLYQHDPLPVQFESQKVRQIELDIFVDSVGGRYATPLLRSVAGTGPLGPEMSEPGIKVLHIQDVDYASTCTTLIRCLTQIEQWSDANPTHAPIAVLLELKDTPLSFGDFTFVTPEPFTSARMDELDAEIRSVVDPEDMITPDDVRAGAATLNEAVLGTGWPTLAESRGKVMFLMDNGGGYRTDYLAGHPNLEGRVLFTNASPGDPDAAFIKRNDPFDPSIPGLVADGYVVRTRADGDTVEARANNTAPRDAALASGAQWVSTDYPLPDMGWGFTTSYSAQIPGGTVARCNPVNGPAECVSAEIDTIYNPIQRPPASTTTTSPSAPTTAPPTTGTPPGATPIRRQPNYTG